jgi:hypothetical protein
MADEVKARVFVSCSQRRDTDDERFVEWLQELLRKRGFDPYVAIKEHTFRGLKENLFEQIKSSEYFLFVDFKREQLLSEDGTSLGFRGSLFSHQELAIAAYLDLDVLAFQQEGVRETDGVLAVLQVNPVKFKSIPELRAGLLEKHLNKENWSPIARNILSIDSSVRPIDYVEGDLSDEVTLEDFEEKIASGQLQRVYRLAIENRSQSKPALQCAGYLTRCINEDQEVERGYEKAELKWAGVPYPISTVNILAGQKRFLEAVVISYDKPDVGEFNFVSDYGLSGVVCSGIGRYLLEYMILSVNFPEIRQCFRLTLGEKMHEARFEPVDCQELSNKSYPKRQYGL